MQIENEDDDDEEDDSPWLDTGGGVAHTPAGRARKPTPCHGHSLKSTEADEMSMDALKSELEAVYNAAVAALKQGDADAFVAVVQPPVAGTEEAMREQFASAAPYFAQAIPELPLTTFVAIRTEGDDLAGYYHARLDPFNPAQAQIILTQFVRVEGTWKLLLRGLFRPFKLEGEEDMTVQARRIVDTDPSLQLRPSPPSA